MVKQVLEGLHLHPDLLVTELQKDHYQVEWQRGQTGCRHRRDAVQQPFQSHSDQLVLVDGQSGKQCLCPKRNRLDRS